MPHACSPGSLVNVRDAQWRVARVDAFEQCAIVTLEAAGGPRLRVIDPIDRVVPARAGRIKHRRRRGVLQAALRAVSSQRPPLSLWTASRAAIDLLPYQLEPALAVLRGATRLLLADAVGLGKTIQAGLILAELRERGFAERALVLCPPGLRSAWAGEFEQRFGIGCTTLDPRSLADTAAALPPGINPWTMHTTVIASIDFVKRPEVFAAVAQVPFDVVIADEAHHLTPGTDRGEAVHQLASRAPWCILVSATPHSGDNGAFEYLTRIGSEGEALTIFRRSRRDAGLESSRRERVIAMRPSAAEIELLDAVEHYARAIWHGRGARDSRVQLVAITIARRAASSPHALRRTLQRRLALLSSLAEPVQTVLPWEEQDDGDGSGSAELLATAGLDSDAAERDAIERLLRLIDRCGPGAKLQWLVAAFRRLKEPAIVFTEYRDTLEAVVSALPHDVRVASICGDTPIGLRRAAIDSFNRGGADLLIATDTAGEGLNLHHRCRLVIDIELPWNPMRLEQRLGRVDRLGQLRRVHAVRLFHPGTIEHRVLDRLQVRRTRAASFDRFAAVDEREVGAAIFGSADGEMPPVPPIVTAVVTDVGREHARLMRLRGEHHVRRSDAAFASIRSGRTGRKVTTVHSIVCANEAGAIVAELACAHAVTADYCAAEDHGRTFKEIARSPSLGSALRAHTLALCGAVTGDLTPLRDAVASRIAAIRSRVANQRTRDVQPSLFDARAAVAAERHHATLDGFDLALQRRCLSVSAPVTAETALPRLIAMWSEQR